MNLSPILHQKELFLYSFSVKLLKHLVPDTAPHEKPCFFLFLLWVSWPVLVTWWSYNSHHLKTREMRNLRAQLCCLRICVMSGSEHRPASGLAVTLLVGMYAAHIRAPKFEAWLGSHLQQQVMAQENGYLLYGKPELSSKLWLQSGPALATAGIRTVYH